MLDIHIGLRINYFRLMKHYERCKKCKETVYELLRKEFGNVEKNYSIDTSTQPEFFKDSNYYPKLNEIFNKIGKKRNKTDFVKARKLSGCDYFIPDKKIIVEFDESQHFTPLRKIALQSYNEEEFSFDVKKWINLCEKIHAKDNDPEYRDEQRAWYDTLRDFVPLLNKNFRPTIRLYAKDFVWCSLDPENPNDVKKFQSFLRTSLPSIEIINEENPVTARIIITNQWSGNPEKAKHLLENVCDKWPKDVKTKILQSKGAFIQFQWPKNLTREKIGDNKNPNPEAVKILKDCADRVARKVLSIELQEKLSSRTRYVSFGVDSYKEKISTTDSNIHRLHIELVCCVDLKNGTWYWTGKSYPTPGQENGLVRILDFESHFVDTGDDKLMLLGCHDLTIYSNRGAATTKQQWKKRTREKIQERAKEFHPEFVLQHPHETESKLTWNAQIKELQRQIPSVKFASSGSYYSKKYGKRDPLDEVLAKTKNHPTIDFIINF